jgi:hypothetical protein
VTPVGAYKLRREWLWCRRRLHSVQRGYVSSSELRGQTPRHALLTLAITRLTAATNTSSHRRERQTCQERERASVFIVPVGEASLTLPLAIVCPSEPA